MDRKRIACHRRCSLATSGLAGELEVVHQRKRGARIRRVRVILPTLPTGPSSHIARRHGTHGHVRQPAGAPKKASAAQAIVTLTQLKVADRIIDDVGDSKPPHANFCRKGFTYLESSVVRVARIAALELEISVCMVPAVRPYVSVLATWRCALVI